MRRTGALILALAALGGCVPSPQQQAAPFTPTAAVSAARARESRRFDTADQRAILQAVIGALQDLGFTIEESQAKNGIVVGAKLGGGRIRAQAIVLAAADRTSTVVRVTFQRIVPRPGAMLAVGEQLDDPEIYRGFFEKVAQSAFLTAHDI